MKAKPYGIIYLAVNKINGKKYVGQTHGKLEKRIKRHFYKTNNGDTQVFYKALRKYGKSAFEWFVIDSAYSQKELNKKETYWIHHHRTFVDFENSNGYNMTLGGDSTFLSKEARMKISKKAKERLAFDHPNKIAIVQLTLKGTFVAEYSSTAEVVKIKDWKPSTINGCLKGRRKSAYGFLWFYKGEYRKHKNNEANLNLNYDGEYHGSRIPQPIVQLTLQGEFIKTFSNALEAALSVKGYNSTLIACCKGKKQRYKGFRWMYADNYKEMLEQGLVINNNVSFKGNKARPVVQLTKQGTFINEYPSARDGAKAVGGQHPNGVHECCKGNYLTYKGFKWMYADDYEKNIKQGNEIEKIVYLKNSRPVVQLSLQGEFIKEFPSAVGAAISLGAKSGSCVSACCRDKAPTYKGFKWMYTKEYYNMLNEGKDVKTTTPYKVVKPRNIVQLTKQGVFIKELG